MNALLHLARKSELYPHVLVRRDIIIGDKYPVTAGQFGDVWKGISNGQEVAVKVLKLYMNTDISQYHKVSLIRARWCLVHLGSRRLFKKHSYGVNFVMSTCCHLFVYIIFGINARDLAWSRRG